MADPYGHYAFSHGPGACPNTTTQETSPGQADQGDWEDVGEGHGEEPNRERDEKARKEQRRERMAEHWKENEIRRRNAMRARVQRDEAEMEKETTEEMVMVADSQPLFAANPRMVPGLQMEQGESCSDGGSSDTDADSDGDAVDDEDEDQERPEPEPEAGTEEREPPNNSNFKFNSCKTPIPPHSIPQRPKTFTTEHTCDDATNNLKETNYHELITQYLVPFFNHKLAHPSGRYSITDLDVEITGFVLESLRDWFAEVRREGKLESMLSPAENRVNARCNRQHHLGAWMKSFHAEVCEACQRHQPLYTLTCPGCGQKACVSCRFQIIIH
jgi:hypothetical protein